MRVTGIFSFGLFFIFLLPFAYGQCPAGYIPGEDNIIVNGNFEQGNTGFFQNTNLGLDIQKFIQGILQ